MATYKRIHTFHLVGDILWTPVDFLVQRVPNVLKVVDRKTMTSVGQMKVHCLVQTNCEDFVIGYGEFDLVLVIEYGHFFV